MSRAVIQAGWDDVPHLTEKDKADLLASYLPHQRDARSKGVPSLGSGAIYPVPESDIVIDPFMPPKHFQRAYGFDVGWNKTAAAFGAYDRDDDILYITGEHYRGQAEPSIHADAIKARGPWIPGAIDPASRGRDQKKGEQLVQLYRDNGLILVFADNGVEAGLLEVYQRLSTGRLKIFRGACQNLIREYRLYRRDEKGNIVKENDHLMDALRYLVMTGLKIAKTQPIEQARRKPTNWRTQ